MNCTTEYRFNLACAVVDVSYTVVNKSVEFMAADVLLMIWEGKAEGMSTMFQSK